MNASRLVKSYAPLGLFLGGVGYLAWPYIDPENEPAQAKAEVPALEAKWLAPVFPPSAKRDPFRIVLPVVVANTGSYGKWRSERIGERACGFAARIRRGYLLG